MKNRQNILCLIQCNYPPNETMFDGGRVGGGWGGSGELVRG